MGQCRPSKPSDASSAYEDKDVVLGLANRRSSASKDGQTLVVVPARRRVSAAAIHVTRIVNESNDEAKIAAAVEAADAAADVEFVLPNFAKGPDETKFIIDACHHNLVFSEMTAKAMEDIAGAMELVTFEADETPIEEGELGDFFYAIQSGTFDVEVDGSIISHYHAGGTFGELALLFNAPRKATVRATSAAVCYKLERRVFKHYLSSTSEKEHQRQVVELHMVPLLSDNLSEEQIAQLAAVMRYQKAKPGERIVSKGDDGDAFYMIKSGKVICEHIGATETVRATADVHLSRGEYFGEMALLKNEPRAADVSAVTESECMVLSREDFQHELGNLKELMERAQAAHVLASVPTLNELNAPEQRAAADLMKSVTYENGDVLFEQHKRLARFHVIQEGHLTVLADDDDSGGGGGKARRRGSEGAKLSPGDYVGEQSLVYVNAIAPFTVMADGRCTCWVLDSLPFMVKLNEMHDREERRLERLTRELEAPKLKDLKKDGLLGKGSFGRVELVTWTDRKGHQRANALKAISKVGLMRPANRKANILRSTQRERDLLFMVHHPFILELVATYQDQCNLYMLFELVQGGELYKFAQQQPDQRMGNDDAKFYSACVLDALDCIHEKKICYRDLKPENLMIDREGYIRVVDFGFAKIVPNQTFTVCGTPEYLAPEVVLSKGHSKGVDYWALGVLTFELLVGRSPFRSVTDANSPTHMELFKRIVDGKYEIPNEVDRRARSVIKKLLVRKPSKRLGCGHGGAQAIKQEPFFAEIDFVERLRTKMIAAPWKPTIRHFVDKSNFLPDDALQHSYYAEEAVPYRGGHSVFGGFESQPGGTSSGAGKKRDERR